MVAGRHERGSSATDTDWPQYQLDSQNTAYAPDARGPRLSATVRWSKEIAATTYGASPVVRDETVYVVGGDAYAFDATDGTERWRTERGGRTSEPAVTRNALYFCGGSNADTLYAASLDDGTPKWEYPLEERVARPIATETDADGNDTVYFGDFEGYLYAVSDGKPQWETNLGRFITTSPVLGTDIVYCAATDDVIDALVGVRKSNGNLVWKYDPYRDASENVQMESPSLRDDVLYAPFFARGVHAVDIDGDELWEYEATVTSGTAVDETSVYICVGGYEGTTPKLVAIDRETGDKTWAFTLPGDARVNPVVVGDLVYVDAGSSLFGIDAATGAEQWRFDAPISGRLGHSIAVGDGVLYAASEDDLYALEDGGERTPTPSPTSPPTDVGGEGGGDLSSLIAIAGGITATALLGGGALRYLRRRQRVDGQQPEESGERPNEYIVQAESALDDGDEARTDGDYATAAEAYSTAVDAFQTARDLLPADDDRKDAIDAALAEAETAQQRASEQRDRRANLRQRLAAAEEDLVTALREHAQGNTTVARVRYRQARDRYEDLLGNLNSEDLTPALEVSRANGGRPPIETVAGLDEDARERLLGADLASANALRDADREALTAVEGIDQQVSIRLSAWATIPGDDTLQIDEASVIQQRRDRASEGFQQCR